MARLQANDIAALATLVQRHQVNALRIAYGIVRDRSLAEDVVQAAFLSVYDHRSQFDLRRPFRPWFFRIVVNTALKAVKRQDRTISINADHGADDPAITLSLADPGADPLDLVAHAETYAELWAAMGRLTPEQRAVLLQRYYLELSEAEMSARLDVPAGTIKSRLFNARKQLAALLHPLLRP
jgi:RNA polymerase sigma-70 factor (ECF subfamily)